MNQTMPCPYCGGIGYHKWSGTGACPGLINPNPPIVLTGSTAFALEIAALKALLTRAANALDDVRYADREPGHEKLIAELRKAAAQ